MLTNFLISLGEFVMNLRTISKTFNLIKLYNLKDGLQSERLI